MLTWMQDAVVRPVQGMTKQDLDHLFDAHANSIGALLLHLAATETYHQMNTFLGIKWDSWPDAVKQKWDPVGAHQKTRFFDHAPVCRGGVIA